MINLIKGAIEYVYKAFACIPLFISLFLFAVLCVILGPYYIIKYYLKH